MIKNYFISAYRNLVRKKLYTFINLMGLTLGTTCCLFIFLYVQNEYNYDKFHVDGERIFRVLRKSNDDKGAYNIGLTSGPFAPALMNDFENVVINAELGFNKENVVLLPFANRNQFDKREQIKQQLMELASVKSMTFVSGEPGGFHDNYSFTIPGEERKNINMRTLFTDYDFQKVFEISLAMGRTFSQDFGTDAGEAVIINEEAIKYLGWNEQETIGKLIQNNFTDTIPKKVIGVIKNYHFTSLKNKIDPLVIAIGPYLYKTAVKIDGQAPWATIKNIEKTWEQFADGFPFAYSFLDKQYDNLYHAEKKQRELFTIFTGIAILIACLGLFGLATFSAERRIKEIGIRKILGARVISIFLLLSRDLLKLVLIACILSLPLAWWFMELWLNNFVYSIDIQFWMILSAALAALFVAFVTVFYHGLKAGHTNPADTLRTE